MMIRVGGGFTLVNKKKNVLRISKMWDINIKHKYYLINEIKER